MTTITIVFLVTFALAVLFGPLYIPLLRKLKFGQTVRYNGPQSHLKKQGTPTIGGLIFLTPLVPVCLFLYYKGEADRNIIPLLLVTVGFGFVGFLDDFIKIVKKRKDGLYWYQKITLLFVVSLAFVFYISENSGLGQMLSFKFFGVSAEINISWLFIPFCILILLASTNAVNLSDGLDGLCCGASFIVFVFFTVVTMIIPEYRNPTVSLFAVSLAGGLLGFLLFNYHPARVFMGDTGSLALGGAMGACAILMRQPLILLLAGLLFVIEAMSVILQVVFFKVTKGKRLFRMAPIHHHFELCGWAETKVVYAFWIFTLLCCIAAYYCLAL